MLVKFNARRLLGFHGKMILPGINDLEPALVSQMMDDPILAVKFDSGELEIIGKEDLGAKVKAKAGKEVSGVEILLAAAEGAAKNAAGQTVDLKILEAWLSKEKRVSVKKAIKAQISKITNIQYRDKDSKSKLEKASESEGDEE